MEVDMLSWMGRTTLEILGQAGLGYSFDPLTEDCPDDFANAVKDLLYAPLIITSMFGQALSHRLRSPQMVKTSIMRLLLPYVAEIGSAAFRRRIVEMFPSKGVQRLRDIYESMHERSVLIFNEKKAALAKGHDALKHQIGEGRDIMSILRMYPLA